MLNFMLDLPSISGAFIPVEAAAEKPQDGEGGRFAGALQWEATRRQRGAQGERYFTGDK